MVDQLNATPTFTVNKNNDKSTTTTGNKTATARLILLPSIVSICWMLEMNGIIQQGQRNNFVGRIFITRSCCKDFEKDGIVLDYAMMVTLFFFFSFLIFKFDSNRQHQFKWLLVKYVSQGSILCHLLLFMRIMTSL